MQGYLPVTSPVTPHLSDGLLLLLVSESLTPGPPVSLEYFLAYDILLLDSAADLPQLAVPLLPPPDDLQLLADAALNQLPVSTHHSLSLEPNSSVVSPPQDLSREGLFDPYCAAADTGDAPLFPAGLPGCQYRMTSYDSAEVADVEPAYRLQLHHPRFLKFVAVPESARFLTRTPGHWVDTMDRDVTVAGALQLQRDAGLMYCSLQVVGQFVTLLNRMSSEVMRLAF